MELNIKTTKTKEVIDITEEVNNLIKKSGKENGLINIFVAHTTAAITTADLDPGGTDQDYLDALNKIVPDLNYRHPHDPSHMPDHILSSMIGTSITLPFENSKLLLGTWQKVVLIEFNGPKDRKIIVTY